MNCEWNIDSYHSEYIRRYDESASRYKRHPIQSLFSYRRGMSDRYENCQITLPRNKIPDNVLQDTTGLFVYQARDMRDTDPMSEMTNSLWGGIKIDPGGSDYIRYEDAPSQYNTILSFDSKRFPIVREWDGSAREQGLWLDQRAIHFQNSHKRVHFGG